MNILETPAAASYVANTEAAKKKSGMEALDGQAFMMLLMAQLKNQNPLEPMDEKEMMGQVTSLNSLQELTSMKKSLESMRSTNEVLYGASLIGKTVTIQGKDGASTQGVVSQVLQSAGSVSVRVGEQEYPLSQVVEVGGSAA